MNVLKNRITGKLSFVDIELMLEPTLRLIDLHGQQNELAAKAEAEVEAFSPSPYANTVLTVTGDEPEGLGVPGPVTLNLIKAIDEAQRKDTTGEGPSADLEAAVAEINATIHAPDKEEFKPPEEAPF
jgi:hypothetical protein